MFCSATVQNPLLSSRDSQANYQASCFPCLCAKLIQLAANCSLTYWHDSGFILNMLPCFLTLEPWGTTVETHSGLIPFKFAARWRWSLDWKVTARYSLSACRACWSCRWADTHTWHTSICEPFLHHCDMFSPQAGQYTSIFVDNAAGASITIQNGSDFMGMLLGV